ncbi:MAG TPA: hypothetical protein VEF04_10620, partial [Blastocatellia bacterium]|nr:hypothetical protein [Blastocatellia bacterium]
MTRQNVLQAFTFDAFCEIAFGYAPNAMASAWRGEKEPFLKSFDHLQSYISERLVLPPSIWHLMRLFQVGHQAEVTSHSKIVRDYVAKIVQSRKEGLDNSNGDMLSLYIHYARQN